MPQNINENNEFDLEIRTEKGMRYLIQFPIGDWSGDGHNFCDYFFAASEKPLKVVREAHFKSLEVLGFNIGEVCKEDQDSQIPRQMTDKLKKLGYNFEEDPDRFKEMFDMWLFLLNNTEPTLKLERIEMPSINFYGVDSQGRHLDTPGYGLFE